MLLWPSYTETPQNPTAQAGCTRGYYEGQSSISDHAFDASRQIRDDTQVRIKSSRPQLFVGEVVERVGPASCLYKYMEPRNKVSSTTESGSDLPLVVLIPGGAHNARIFYGGHVGSNEEDFLAFWLVHLGFPVLAVSYPLEYDETDVPIPSDAPNFRISDWGQQTALVTKTVVDRHPELAAREILVAGWSMGGRILGPFVKHATEDHGLRVSTFVSLAATPGVGGMRPVPPGINCTTNGYATCKGLLDMFLKQIREQEMQSSTTRHSQPSKVAPYRRLDSSVVPTSGTTPRHIIPPDVFTSQYFGHTPVSLHGWQLAHRLQSDGINHDFIPDKWGSEEDAAPTDFCSLPWITSITGTSASDARHALLDELTWNNVGVQRLTAIWEQWAGQGNATTDSTWRNFSSLSQIAYMHKTLHEKVEGNHYFFLGRRGARTTAQSMKNLWRRTRSLQTRLDEVLAKDGSDSHL